MGYRAALFIFVPSTNIKLKMIENIQPPIAKIIPTELENSGTLELIIILVKGSRKS
jgi:hypothetical protein